MPEPIITKHAAAPRSPYEAHALQLEPDRRWFYGYDLAEVGIVFPETPRTHQAVIGATGAMKWPGVDRARLLAELIPPVRVTVEGRTPPAVLQRAPSATFFQIST